MPDRTHDYWESLGALNELVGMDTHRVAKEQHERWIGPYRIVIGQVLNCYGQPGLGLEHVPASDDAD